MGAVNVGTDNNLYFGELPDDLIEEILAWLPANYLCRFANVSKQWNTTFSSTRFITGRWAEAPPNKNPWLLVGAMDYSKDCWAYSSFTRSWQRSCFSLSFLEGNEDAVPNPNSSFSYKGSDAGLFVIQNNFTNSIYVCNPLTAKCFVLPPMTSQRWENPQIAEIGITQEGKDGYRVLVVDVPHISLSEPEPKKVRIYDSADQAWRIAGVLPEALNTWIFNPEASYTTVFSGGYFYSLMMLRVDLPEGGFDFSPCIMGFNMLEGTSISVPLPTRDIDYHCFFSQLVTCGSRILYVEGVWHTQGYGITIWEFNKDAATNWREIAVMPQTVFQVFNKQDDALDMAPVDAFDMPEDDAFDMPQDDAFDMPQGDASDMPLDYAFDLPEDHAFDMPLDDAFDMSEDDALDKVELIDTNLTCIGMGDCVYLKKHTVNEVAVYNLAQNSWTLLPSCPIAAVPGDPPLIAFKPRPDMKIQ